MSTTHMPTYIHTHEHTHTIGTAKFAAARVHTLTHSLNSHSLTHTLSHTQTRGAARLAAERAHRKYSYICTYVHIISPPPPHTHNTRQMLRDLPVQKVQQGLITQSDETLLHFLDRQVKREVLRDLLPKELIVNTHTYVHMYISYPPPHHTHTTHGRCCETCRSKKCSKVTSRRATCRSKKCSKVSSSLPTLLFKGKAKEDDAKNRAINGAVETLLGADRVSSVRKRGPSTPTIQSRALVAPE
jgi:hypothetical protein